MRCISSLFTDDPSFYRAECGNFLYFGRRDLGVFVDWALSERRMLRVLRVLRWLELVELELVLTTTVLVGWCWVVRWWLFVVWFG